MEESERLLVFSLDDQRYALYLRAVERVVRMVEITALPKTPEIVLGVINLHGRVIPVVDTCKRFRLRGCEIGLSDQLIIANTAARPIALVADAVAGIIELPKGEVVPADRIVPGMEYVEGVLKLDDGMVLIHDLDRFLSLDEEKALDNALQGIKKGG